MPIKGVVESLDNVDEGLRDFYVEKDGYFVFDVEPVTNLGGKKVNYEFADTSKLRDNLQNEMANVRTLNEKLKAFEGLDPSELRGQLQELETLRSEGSNIDEKAKSLAKSQVDQVVKEHQKELEQREQLVNKYRGSLEKTLIENKLADAIMKAGGDEKTVTFLMPHLKGHAVLREAGDDFVAEVIDPATGNPRIGDSSGNAMSLEQLVTSDFKNHPVFGAAFPGSGKSGGDTSSSRAARSSAGYPKNKSKFSMDQKMDFISEHGANAWRKIPD